MKACIKLVRKPNSSGRYKKINKYMRSIRKTDMGDSDGIKIKIAILQTHISPWKTSPVQIELKTSK